MGQTAQEMLARQAVRLDLEALETPAFHDRLVRAQQQAAFRPLNMVSDLTSMTSSGVAVAGLLLLLIAIQPVLIVFLMAAFIPLWLASVGSGRDFYRFEVTFTSSRRLIAYIQGLLTVRESAKEMRASGLGSYLLEKQRTLFERRLADLRKVARTSLGCDVWRAW